MNNRKSSWTTVFVIFSIVFLILAIVGTVICVVKGKKDLQPSSMGETDKFSS
jgi:hypothetical protein